MKCHVPGQANGFDDFIAAAYVCFPIFVSDMAYFRREYLVNNGYAAKGKIAINGLSNGGRLS